MPVVQQWGRRESIIWPPRRYFCTLGAIFLSLVATGLFVYVRFQFGLSSLERYYLPYYLRTELAGLTHSASTYQLLYISDGKSRPRTALEADVEPGVTLQLTGSPLPLVLSVEAQRQGFRLLFREQPRSYSNKALHTWIEHWVYADIPLAQLFTMQLIFGLVAFALQLPFSIRQDIRRIKGLRYGRRLKGPFLVNAQDFTEAVGGNGIGITTNDSKLPLRIPRDAENKHFLIVGDTGSGKSSIIRQMLYQVDARGDSAIVYDPACEFVKQFYNERRGDIVLNPLDARMPYWNPSKELRREAEAKALRYRTNDYSVPTEYGHRDVLVKGYVHEVVIVCGSEIIARHRRSYQREDMVFDPLHYLALLEQKARALDQAAPLAGWELPECFARLRRLLEARLNKGGKREYVQVLRLLETFSLQEVEPAIRDALHLGTIGFDAVKHLLLCRIERRPPRLDLENYPHLPLAEVQTTQAADYMALLSAQAIASAETSDAEVAR